MDGFYSDPNNNGLFRIIKNSKIGYADYSTGEIVIQPVYDFALWFENGTAQVNVGGHEKKRFNDYELWVGGKWGIIDRKGNLLLDLKYDRKCINRNIILYTEEEEYMVENGKIKKIK